MSSSGQNQQTSLPASAAEPEGHPEASPGAGDTAPPGAPEAELSDGDLQAISGGMSRAAGFTRVSPFVWREPK